MDNRHSIGSKIQKFRKLKDIKSANKATRYNKLDIKNDSLYDNCKNKFMQ